MGMPSRAERPPLPPVVVAEWLDPFLAHLGQERRYSAYTLRNYRKRLRISIAGLNPPDS